MCMCMCGSNPVPNLLLLLLRYYHTTNTVCSSETSNAAVLGLGC